MSNSSHILKPDAQAIFLLCGRLGSHDNKSAKPLTLSLYNKLAKWLNNKNLRPGDLLGEEGQEQLSVFGSDGKLTEERLRTLLQRGAAMAMAVEEWTNKGGWILARSDDNYPKRFRKRLRRLAPPILYGVGDQKLLEHGGVSMVGSRDSDEASLAFVRDLAYRCAKEGISVVSGGARGVDRASMDAALKAGGIVVGALANGLTKTSRKKKYREAITDNRLTLVSAYHPNSRFQVWKAMDRNKHIYALGDGTVVAHSAVGSGGTWSGATENLKQKWVPLFVRAEPPIPDGNRKLIEMGGHPIDRRVFRGSVHVKDWLKESVSLDDIEPAIAQFEPQSTPSEDEISNIQEESAEDQSGQEDMTELFPLVWPKIKPLLREPRGEKEVREHFDDLHLGQARDWLMMAVDRGLAVREERPVRYVQAKGVSANKTSMADSPSDETGSNHSPNRRQTVDSADNGNRSTSEKKNLRDRKGKTNESSLSLFD